MHFREPYRRLKDAFCRFHQRREDEFCDDGAQTRFDCIERQFREAFACHPQQNVDRDADFRQAVGNHEVDSRPTPAPGVEQRIGRGREAHHSGAGFHLDRAARAGQTVLPLQ